MISAQREAELAGTDNWEALADALSLHRYREILNATSIEDLQRSAVAVFTVTTLQGMIVFMGMWPVVAMRTGAIDAVPAEPQCRRPCGCQGNDKRPGVAAVGCLPAAGQPSKHGAGSRHEHPWHIHASWVPGQRRGIQ